MLPSLLKPGLTSKKSWVYLLTIFLSIGGFAMDGEKKKVAKKEIQWEFEQIEMPGCQANDSQFEQESSQEKPKVVKKHRTKKIRSKKGQHRRSDSTQSKGLAQVLEIERPRGKERQQFYHQVPKKKVYGAFITREQCVQSSDTDQNWRDHFGHGQKTRSLHMRKNFLGEQQQVKDCNQAVWQDLLAEEVIFTKIDAQQNVIENVNLQGRFDGLNFDGSQIEASTFQGQLIEASFNNCNMRKVDFKGVNVDRRHGQNASFQNTKIKYSRFKNCDLKNIDFRRAKLKQVDFSGSIIHSSTDFRGAQIWDEQEYSYVDVTNQQLEKHGASLTPSRRNNFN